MSLVAGDTTRSRTRARVSANVAAPVANIVVVAEEQSAPKRRRLAMSINRINDALVKAMEKPPSADGTVFVCHATEDEWDAFVESEDPAPALKTKHLEWFEAAREIHIVELPSAAHECLGLSLHNMFRTHANASRWLRSRGSSLNQQGRRLEPDCSFGPASSTPGAVLPRLNMEWSDFNTIKVEIGVVQQWGDRAGQLDHKAVAVWYGIPGVEYVLCIKTDNRLTAAEYKLYDFQLLGGPSPAVQPRATAIVPNAIIAFDAHRILGIPPASSLPAGFPDPFVVDLHAALQEARADL